MQTFTLFVDEMLDYVRSTPFYVSFVLLIVACVALFIHMGGDAMLLIFVSLLAGSVVIVSWVKTAWKLHRIQVAESRERLQEMTHIKVAQAQHAKEQRPQYQEVARTKVLAAVNMSPARMIDARITEELDDEDAYYRTRVLPESLANCDASSRQLPAVVQQRRDEGGPRIGAQNSPIVHLAKNCNPPITEVIGKSAVFLGQRGTGKSMGMGRYIEQINKLPCFASLVIDYTGEYVSMQDLHKHCVIAGAPDWEGQYGCKKYWKITKENAYAVGYALFENQEFVVFQTQSYGESGDPANSEMDVVAEIITLLIKGMVHWGKSQKDEGRIPGFVFLDEATYYMPENTANSDFSKPYQAAFVKIFRQLNLFARKWGITPVLAAQRPQEVKKSAITGAELYFLFGQKYPLDLDFYEELIGKGALASFGMSRDTFKRLQPGDCVVWEGDECWQIHFYERQSTHKGKTPGWEDALRHHRKRDGMEITPHTIELLGSPDNEEDEEEWDDLVTKRLPETDELAPSLQMKPKTDMERVVELVKNEPNLSYREVGERLGFGKDKAGSLVREAQERGLLAK